MGEQSTGLKLEFKPAALSPQLLGAVRTLVIRSDRIVADEDSLGEFVASSIIIVMKGAKLLLDAKARGVAEKIYRFEHTFVLRVRGFEQALGSEAGRSDGKNFGADVNEAAKQKLLTFKFGAIPNHGVEHRTGEPAAGTSGVAEMAPQKAG
jgi:hypothetical protein